MSGPDAAACPCGSDRETVRCCAPVLAGRPAPTAERLMRSRYTAHVLGDVDHLLASWHPSTRPVALTPDRDVTWTGLTVLATRRGELLDDEGVVEFRATWVREEPGVLHEVSRFVRDGRHWFYVDGLTP